MPLASLSRNRIKSLLSVAENVVFGDTRNEEMKREKREGGLGHDAAPHADEAVHPVVMKLENGDMNVTFSRRCQLESEKLSNECPEHLKHVQQAFLKQAEAFNLADQCNQGLPVLNRPEIRISENTAVPNPKELLKKDKEVKDVSEVVQEDKTTEDGSHDTSTGIVISFPEPEGPPPPIVRMDITESQEAKADKEKRIQKMKELLLKLNGGVDPGAQVHPPGEDNQTTERIGAIMTQVKHKKDNTYEDEILSKPRYPQVIKVFCVETANEKQGTYYRKFAACSISAVWNTYLSTDPSRMHWYEIIREDLPCHLYFDVEFRRTDGLNQNVDGEKMVDLWIGHVNTMLEYVESVYDTVLWDAAEVCICHAVVFPRAWCRRNFGLHVEDKNIFELDSSSESKFSRHIIMRIPGYAFYNNIAVGDFVAQVLSACGRDLLVDVEHKGCPDRTRGFFVDTAVYTKNRHFRLAYSCKGGKAAVLMPTGRYAMAVGRRDLPTPAEILKKTMVTVVDSNSTLLCIRPLKEYAQNNPRVTSHGGTSTRSGPLATTKFDEKDMDRINPTALPSTSSFRMYR